MRYLAKPRWSREDRPVVRRRLVLVVSFYMTGLLLTGSALYVKNAFESGSAPILSARAASVR